MILKMVHDIILTSEDEDKLFEDNSSVKFSIDLIMRKALLNMLKSN